MCKFKSAIVIRDEKVKGGFRLLMSPWTESHSELCQIYKLNDTAKALLYFARVEYSPPSLDVAHLVDGYKLKIDEERTPEWFDEEMKSEVTLKLKDYVSRMIVSGNVDLLIGGQFIIAPGAKVSSAQCIVINAMCGGTLNMMCGGTLNMMCGGTLNMMCGGTLDTMRGGTLNEMWGGTLNKMCGGTLNTMWGGTLDTMRGGTLNEMWGGTLNEMRGGTLNAMCGGTLNAMWGGTLNEMWGGTLNEMRGGTLNAMCGGTLNAMWGGTLNTMQGGTLNEMWGGTLNEMQGGTLIQIWQHFAGLIGNVGSDAKIITDSRPVKK